MHLQVLNIKKIKFTRKQTFHIFHYLLVCHFFYPPVQQELWRSASPAPQSDHPCSAAAL